MRTLPLVQWLESRDIPARIAYTGSVGWDAPSMEHRAYCHAPSVTYRVIAAADRWALEFSDGGPQVCRVLPVCPQPHDIAPFFERSLDHSGYCGVLDPDKDQAHLLLPAPPPPRVVAAPPPPPPSRLEQTWSQRRNLVEGALIRFAWLTVGILTGLAL